MSSEVIGAVINAIFTLMAIIATIMISQWYHKKKTKSDIHFDGQREYILDDLRYRTGNVFSQFKKECKYVIIKREIYAQDLVAFGTRNYDQLIKNIEANQKNITDRNSSYLKYVSIDEYDHHLFFFHVMLRFLRMLQIKKSSNHWGEDYKIFNTLKDLNDTLEIIKLQEKEYDGISHITYSQQFLSRQSSLRVRGIKYYKTPSPLH